MKKLLTYSAAITTFFILVFAPQGLHSQAQSDDSRYFPQTGHWVSGPFLAKYDQASNPLLVYGFPITAAFEDENGILVQYFDKARLELIISETGRGEVRITPIGKHIYEAENIHVPAAVPVTPSACQSFSETSKSVCYAFLDTYLAHGGLAQFGLPVSNFEIRGNRTVQYFENARFDWYPERTPGQRVVIFDLGRTYFEHRGENPQRLKPDGNGNFLPGIIELQTRAFITRVPAIQGQRALIFVIVSDQNNNEIEGASVSFIVHYPDGNQERFIMNETTNKSGFTMMEFPVSSNIKGIAEIVVRATRFDLESETRTSFRIWY